jgi:hypothetical protein
MSAAYPPSLQEVFIKKGPSQPCGSKMELYPVGNGVCCGKFAIVSACLGILCQR